MENNLIFETVITRHQKYKPATAYLQKELEDEITLIANELRLSKEVVRSVFVSQFRLINRIVGNCVRADKEDFDINKYKSVRLPFIGRFEVKKAFKRKYEDNS